MRDVAVGTLAVEGAKAGYAQAAPQLEGWWAEVVAAATVAGEALPF